MKNSGLSEPLLCPFLPHKTQSRIWIQLNACLSMFILDEVAFALYPVGLTFYLPVDFPHFIFNIPESLPCAVSWCDGLDTQSSPQSQCNRSRIHKRKPEIPVVTRESHRNWPRPGGNVVRASPGTHPHTWGKPGTPTTSVLPMNIQD